VPCVNSKLVTAHGRRQASPPFHALFTFIVRMLKRRIRTTRAPPPQIANRPRQHENHSRPYRGIGLDLNSIPAKITLSNPNLSLVLWDLDLSPTFGVLTQELTVSCPRPMDNSCQSAAKSGLNISCLPVWTWHKNHLRTQRFITNSVFKQLKNTSLNNYPHYRL